jgi:hypothetical protein
MTMGGWGLQEILIPNSLAVILCTTYLNNIHVKIVTNWLVL